MTTNQIAFAKLKEEQRHNQMTEEQLAKELAENRRHSMVTEGEAGRHNTATEMEAQRHNVITEQEAQRSNLANEQLKERSILEDIRTHQATEGLRAGELAESERSHKMNERLKQEDVWNTQTQLAESNRHNLITEGETARHNIEQEKLIHAEANLTEAKIPGALADATYTNVNSDYTLSKTKGQNIENQYKGRLMQSEINANTARAVKDSWTSIMSLIGNVSTGAGLMGFGLNAYPGTQKLLSPGYSLITQ